MPTHWPGAGSASTSTQSPIGAARLPTPPILSPTTRSQASTRSGRFRKGRAENTIPISALMKRTWPPLGTSPALSTSSAIIRPRRRTASSTASRSRSSGRGPGSWPLGLLRSEALRGIHQARKGPPPVRPGPQRAGRLAPAARRPGDRARFRDGGRPGTQGPGQGPGRGHGPVHGREDRVRSHRVRRQGRHPGHPPRRSRRAQRPGPGRRLRGFGRARAGRLHLPRRRQGHGHGPERRGLDEGRRPGPWGPGPAALDAAPPGRGDRDRPGRSRGGEENQSVAVGRDLRLRPDPFLARGRKRIETGGTTSGSRPLLGSRHRRDGPRAVRAVH
ncbi:MAG: hypothetical protein MZV64_64030 [Ignavibacteriales bacterium]|nr:hypothetical protein [Ignavibacteriales bacterium]